MLVTARYHLPRDFAAALRERPSAWEFGELGAAVYYRTYSRDLDSHQESWADTVIRVVEGVMSVRKDHFQRVLGSRWNEAGATTWATELAEAIFTMKLLPPGRGLWAMGTPYVYERGSHALNNCGFVDVTTSLANAAYWMMDSLMCGVGVGFSTLRATSDIYPPLDEERTFKVPDTREGWAEAVRQLIFSYEKKGSPTVRFDYASVRPEGSPIRGFGGVASGPGPLSQALERVRGYLDARLAEARPVFAGGVPLNSRTITDTMNAIGACVVSGGVRRSSEIALGSPRDEQFLDLKDYSKHPEREEIGWMSNNTAVLGQPSDFELLPELAKRIPDRGEPGILNLMNVWKYGRIGEKRRDEATGVNPCGEIPLEDRELCNLVEVFPTRCEESELTRVVQLATFYASSVALLRSHDVDTNTVLARNRRIGVSVSGVADWIDATSVAHVFGSLNRAYDVVRETNRDLARAAGVPESVRVTTVKPSGTISLLAGVSPGMHFPFSGYVLRRMRVTENTPVADLLAKAGVPHEPDAYSDRTTVFEFPLRYGSGRTRSVKNVSVYEQAAIVAMLQRCWADNAVSNTLTFQPSEVKDVERVLALFAPVVKSLSLMPDKDGEQAYVQMPLEHITKSEYEERGAKLKPVDWRSLHGSDGTDERYCTTDACELPRRA